MNHSANSQKGHTHALVIGASMGGLLAARALRDHFDHVTLLERDALPETPEFRAGVPQSRHVHILLARGYDALERFFPGIMTSLNDKGAMRLVWGQDTRYLTPGGWVKPFNSGIVTNLLSRTLLETEVRHWLMGYTNVTIRSRIDVDDLVFSEDKRRVTGVVATTRGGRMTETIHADLVVDTSGRRSKLPEWLAARGYAAPEESAVLSDMSYASRRYRKPPGAHPLMMFLLSRPRENLKRGGAIFEIEGGEWLITLGGINGDAPPTDEAGFLAYAKTLAGSNIYDAMLDAEPLGDIYGYRVDGSRWRHYERMTGRPENLIVMGDAVCGFNPLYGQGMTVAAKEAEVLSALLAKANTHDLTGFAARFQKGIVPAIKAAWLMATGEDLRHPGTIGEKPNAAARFAQRYIDLMMATSLNDEAVTLAFMKVTNLSEPVVTLFSPRIVARVLFNALISPRPATSPSRRTQPRSA